MSGARDHGLAHELLSAPEVHARFPGFVLPNEMSGFFEPRNNFAASSSARGSGSGRRI